MKEQIYETPQSQVISMCTEQIFAQSGIGGENVKPGGNDNNPSAAPCSIWG